MEQARDFKTHEEQEEKNDWIIYEDWSLG